MTINPPMTIQLTPEQYVEVYLYSLFEFRQWLDDNCIKPPIPTNRFALIFETSADAAAFKMRWM